MSLQKGPLYIYDNKEKPRIAQSRRIGLSAGQELELRFFIQGNKFVSK
ncbi:MAG: DNA-3-methyladenine glycosylase [Candidatus Margulisbacteria bacterium]|nr:DNA-3-methyladenine glycosylase [Candidatus Margulisiibacteriota bacterium]